MAEETSSSDSRSVLSVPDDSDNESAIIRSLLDNSDSEHSENEKIEEIVQEKNSWLTCTFRRLFGSFGMSLRQISLLFILAAIVLDWSHLALFIIAILIVKAEFIRMKEESKDVMRQTTQNPEPKESDEYGQVWDLLDRMVDMYQQGKKKQNNSPPQGAIELDSDEESEKPSRFASIYEDPPAEDFEMDPAMANNGQKIEWKGGDVPVYGIKILKAFAEGKEPKDESEIKYDPKQVPEELVDVDPLRFLQNPRDFNFCFLPKDVLVRICSMLPVAEFLNLSSTCRFLRWRMYAFCTCYISNPVVVKLRTRKIIKHKEYDIMPRDVYDTSKFENVKEFTGLFAYAPPCFKKPFFCETLVIKMKFDKFEEADCTRALSILLPLRCFARRAIVHHDARPLSRSLNFDYVVLNDFYESLNATSFRYWEMTGASTAKIYANCPFTKEMDMVWINGESPLGRPSVTPNLNRIAYYDHASDEAIKNVIKEFLYGEKNLDFHVYMGFSEVIYRYTGNIGYSVGYQLVDYLFNRYEDWQEYFSEKGLHLWYTTVKENGRRIKLRIHKGKESGSGLMIGKEELFDRMEQHYNIYFYQSRNYKDGNNEWNSDEVCKMDTAIEPDDCHRPSGCSSREENLDYLAANEFFKILNATSFLHIKGGVATSKIFMNCPFTREMDMVWIDGGNELYDVIPFNRIGYYFYPVDDVIKDAINEFLYGQENLEFHAYTHIDRSWFHRFPLYNISSIAMKTGRSISQGKGFHLWYTTVEENGRRIKLRIHKDRSGEEAGVMIGKEELFDRMEEHFNIFFYQSTRHYWVEDDDSEWNSDKIWKMDTTIESDDVDEE